MLLFSLGVSLGADLFIWSKSSRTFLKTSSCFLSFVKASDEIRQSVMDGTSRCTMSTAKVYWTLFSVLTPNLKSQDDCNTATGLKLIDIQLVSVADEVSHPFNICHRGLFVADESFLLQIICHRKTMKIRKLDNGCRVAEVLGILRELVNNLKFLDIWKELF